MVCHTNFVQCAKPTTQGHTYKTKEKTTSAHNDTSTEKT